MSENPDFIDIACKTPEVFPELEREPDGDEGPDDGALLDLDPSL